MSLSTRLSMKNMFKIASMNNLKKRTYLVVSRDPSQGL